MAVKIPFPIPDPVTGEWDPFALKMNFNFLERKIDTAVSMNQAGILFRETGAPIIEVVDTDVETSVYETTIPAGALETFRTIRTTIQGDLLNTSGSNAYALRCYFGGTAFAQFISPSLGGSATRRGWSAIVTITATGAASQFSSGENRTGSTGVDGTSEIASDTRISTYSAGSINHAVAQALVWTVQLSSALTTLSIRPFFVLGELV